jgi:hypothetical protein
VPTPSAHTYLPKPCAHTLCQHLLPTLCAHIKCPNIVPTLNARPLCSHFVPTYCAHTLYAGLPFGVLAAFTVKIAVFRYMTSCSLVMVINISEKSNTSIPKCQRTSPIHHCAASQKRAIFSKIPLRFVRFVTCIYSVVMLPAIFHASRPSVYCRSAEP